LINQAQKLFSKLKSIPRFLLVVFLTNPELVFAPRWSTETVIVEIVRMTPQVYLGVEVLEDFKQLSFQTRPRAMLGDTLNNSVFRIIFKYLHIRPLLNINN